MDNSLVFVSWRLMMEKEQLVRSSRIVSNLVGELIPQTLIETKEMMLVESSRLGEDWRVENLELVEVWWLLMVSLPGLILWLKLFELVFVVLDSVSLFLSLFNKFFLCC